MATAEDEILEPGVKKDTFEQGFMKFKKFYNQPKECGTTIHVEGYQPFRVEGFRLEKRDANNNLVDITEDDLLDVYKRTLVGDEGEPL